MPRVWLLHGLRGRKPHLRRLAVGGRLTVRALHLCGRAVELVMACSSCLTVSGNEVSGR